jgi:hypothetical protein
VHISGGAEVRDRHALDRGLWQEQVADGGVHSLSEALDLFERRPLVAALPAIELWERSCEVLHRPSGTLARPAQHFQIEGHAHHAGTLLLGFVMHSSQN